MHTTITEPTGFLSDPFGILKTLHRNAFWTRCRYNEGRSKPNDISSPPFSVERLSILVIRRPVSGTRSPTYNDSKRYGHSTATRAVFQNTDQQELPVKARTGPAGCSTRAGRLTRLPNPFQMTTHTLRSPDFTVNVGTAQDDE